MPSKPLPISQAVAGLLRSRRESLGLTLRKVEELSGASGNPIPHSTLARIELGQFDPGVRRLGQLLGLYQLPMQAAGDVLDLEALGGATPIERNPAKLRDRALDAWRHGRIAEALSCFLAFRRRVPIDDEHRTMRQEAIRDFAVAAASLGRLHLSRYMLDELLLERPEPRILVPILIQQSVVWRSLGSPVAALAFIESAATYVRPDAWKHLGWIQHQRARILIDEKQFGEAAKCLSLAARYHRRAGAPHDEALAMLTMINLRFEQGKPERALAAARSTERFAARRKFNRIRLSARVDQARALATMGSIDEAKRLLRSVLADSMIADDNALCFYTHFYLWQAERMSGNFDRAVVELREAAYYLKYVDQNSHESRLIRQEITGSHGRSGGDELAASGPRTLRRSARNGSVVLTQSAKRARRR